MLFSWNNFISFVFLSSRIRHTRCSRDWSSDVCSSDLGDVVVDADAQVVFDSLHGQGGAATGVAVEVAVDVGGVDAVLNRPLLVERNRHVQVAGDAEHAGTLAIGIDGEQHHRVGASGLANLIGALA